MSDGTWEAVAREAQSYRDASIHRVQPSVSKICLSSESLDCSGLPRQLLPPKELEITEAPTENIVVALAERKYTAVEVTTAFLRRAVIAQLATNCVTELLPERALERAKYLDEYLLKHGKTVGALHGLPISVKEHIGMKDLGCNAGFIAWWHKQAPDDALILQILWEAGCVFYARTTQPQTLMHLETCSNLYGPTVNPFNRNLTSGGSSGGEGALLGMRGSCLGIGTDIGGSVRSPAANCGLYSLRPTAKRVPYSGCIDTADGQEQILGTIGPLSTSLEGLSLFMKTVLDAEPWNYEPGLAKSPWLPNEDRFQFDATRKVKIAVMWHDGVVKPHPPVTRALKEVVSKLKDLEWIRIVDWEPYKHDEAWDIISELYFPDGGVTDQEVIKASGEPMLPLSKWIIEENPNVKNHTLSELFELDSKRDDYRTRYLRHWNATATKVEGGRLGKRAGEVDVILCPVGPGVAPKLGTSKYWNYTSQWNLLDYPALVFPVGKVDLGKDMKEELFSPLSVKDEENYRLYAGPEAFEGAPVSLQLVGRSFEDEKVVEIARLVKDAIEVPFASYT